MSSNLFDKLDKTSDHYGEKSDCTVKAVAIALELTYEDAHNLLCEAGRKPCKGFNTYRVIPFIEARGFHVIEVFVDAKTVLTFGRSNARGRFIIKVRQHALAAVNNKIHDWTAGGQ